MRSCSNCGNWGKIEGEVEPCPHIGENKTFNEGYYPSKTYSCDSWTLKPKEDKTLHWQAEEANRKCSSR